MTTESLLAISIGISTGLAIAVVGLAIAVMVLVTARRSDIDTVEELRVAHEALAARLEDAIGEIKRLAESLGGDDA